MAAFFNPGNPTRRPTWRKAGRNEGFRIVAVKPEHVLRLNRKTGKVWVPKVGWVRWCQRHCRLENCYTCLAW
jgi:hypothetical protein